jgi:hypothetical protein
MQLRYKKIKKFRFGYKFRKCCKKYHYCIYLVFSFQFSLLDCFANARNDDERAGAKVRKHEGMKVQSRTSK